MQISNFSISSDGTEMKCNISDAASVTGLRLWKNFDYKDFNLAIDLSYKLTGATSETITISLFDIGETQFDGVYYIEAEDPDEVSLDVTADLTRFKECVLEKIIQSNLGKPCLVENNVEVINAHMALVNLAYAVELQFIDEILNLLKVVNIFCSNECKACGNYKNINDYTSRVYNDPDFIIDQNNII
tara:strand:+ start:94 stop:654 length:561 start_codon:yes stop_codon:yes gene_type:complete